MSAEEFMELWLCGVCFPALWICWIEIRLSARALQGADAKIAELKGLLSAVADLENRPYSERN